VWSYRYRQGMRRRSVQGRPRVLDRLALEEVKIFLGEDSDNVDDIAGLKRVLNEGYRDTKRRCERGTDDSDESDESDDGYENMRMCKGTMFNYLNYAQTDQIDDMHANLL
jgi:hypothetical protein